MIVLDLLKKQFTQKWNFGAPGLSFVGWTVPLDVFVLCDVA